MLPSGVMARCILIGPDGRKHGPALPCCLVDVFHVKRWDGHPVLFHVKHIRPPSAKDN